MTNVIASASNHFMYPALVKASNHLSASKFTKPIRRPVSWLNSYFHTKPGETSKANVFWGDSFNVVRPDGVSVATTRYGIYEPQLTTAFLALVKPGMTVYDVGAHFGYFSILASNLVGPEGFVVSLEPTPSTYQVLCSNFASRENCTAINNAAWCETSEIQLQDYGVASGAYNSVFSPRRGDLRSNDNFTTHNIEAVKLDDLVEQTGKAPDFMKIDTESAEQQVIEGARDVLNTCRPIISMELGEMGVSGAMLSTELIALLCGFEYTPLEVKGPDIVRHQVLEKYEFVNLIFVPNESELLN